MKDEGVKDETMNDDNKYGATHVSPSPLSEFLFVIHVILIILIILVAIYASLATLILTLAIHRLLFIFFKGCIVNKYEKHVAAKRNPNGKYDFFQELYFRITGLVPPKSKGKMVSKGFDYALVTTALTIGLVLHIYNKNKYNKNKYNKTKYNKNEKMRQRNR